MAKFQFNSARRFAHSVSRVAVGTAMVAAFAAPAFAQDAPPAEEEEDAIVVSGFRASLESAVNEKKNSDQILESVSAEDIGKLPDDSIGESIARLPGITSQRLNGRANVIAIRGLGPDFSQTLLNGREQTSTGDNRAVEFDQYPSEVVNQVVVYKAPSASLVGQGLVGTIDVRTIRPLESGKQVLAFGGKVSYADIGALNAGSRDIGYRLNATYVDQFADDTMGIALSAAYTDEPYQLQEFNAWGYGGNGTVASPFVIGGSKSFVTSTQLKRLGFNGTFQAALSDTLMLTVDGFYSNFDDDSIKRGIELPLGFGAFGTTFNPATMSKALFATMCFSGRQIYTPAALTCVTKAATAGTPFSTLATHAPTATSLASKAIRAPATMSVMAQPTPSVSSRIPAGPPSRPRSTIATLA
jgi:iron complex outermembrane recepter protein